MLIGGVAYSYWVEPRATKDIDFSVIIPEKNIPVLINRFKKAGFVTRRSDFNVLKKQHILRFWKETICFDFLIDKDEYYEIALNRRIKKIYLNQAIWIATPEDLILQKILAGRSQDIVDVINLINHRRAELNLKYLTLWARVLGVANTLKPFLE